MNAPTSVRLATRHDEEAIWPLADELATSSQPTRTAFATSYRRILDDPYAAVFVATEPDHEIIGYVHVLVHPAFHADGNIAWVEELIVVANHRDTGCGRSLMLTAENWASSEHDAVYLALATRRAADFYLAIGYDESAVYFKKPLPTS